MIGEGHESLDCDADGDFLARWTAKFKRFQIWHCSRQVRNDLVVHPRGAAIIAGEIDEYLLQVREWKERGVV